MTRGARKEEPKKNTKLSSREKRQQQREKDRKEKEEKPESDEEEQQSNVKTPKQLKQLAKKKDELSRHDTSTEDDEIPSLEDAPADVQANKGQIFFWFFLKCFSIARANSNREYRYRLKLDIEARIEP